MIIMTSEWFFYKYFLSPLSILLFKRFKWIEGGVVINVISNGSLSSESLEKKLAFILVFKIVLKVLLGSMIEKFIFGFNLLKLKNG